VTESVFILVLIGVVMKDRRRRSVTKAELKVIIEQGNYDREKQDGRCDKCFCN